MKSKTKHKRRRAHNRKKKTRPAVTAAARKVLQNPAFLYEVLKKLKDRVVGEARNLLIVFLAALSATLSESVSVLFH